MEALSFSQLYNASLTYALNSSQKAGLQGMAPSQTEHYTQGPEEAVKRLHCSILLIFTLATQETVFETDTQSNLLLAHIFQRSRCS